MGIIKDIFKVFNGSTWDEHYFKTTSDQVVHTKSDGTATTVQAELLAQNSAMKWSDWITLGTNNLGIIAKYRYNAYEVEFTYSGTLAAKAITADSAGYVFPDLPSGFKPNTNIEIPIYAVLGNNAGKLALRCFPGSSSTFAITSHVNLTTTAEYICGCCRYARG